MEQTQSLALDRPCSAHCSHSNGPSEKSSTSVTAAVRRFLDGVAYRRPDDATWVFDLRLYPRARRLRSNLLQ